MIEYDSRKYFEAMIECSRRALLDAVRRNAVDVITSSACTDERAKFLCMLVGDRCRRSGIVTIASKTGQVVRIGSGKLFCLDCFRVAERGEFYYAWPRVGPRQALPWCMRCRLELVYVFELNPGTRMMLRTHTAEQPAVLAEREGFFVA